MRREVLPQHIEQPPLVVTDPLPPVGEADQRLPHTPLRL